MTLSNPTDPKLIVFDLETTGFAKQIGACAQIFHFCAHVYQNNQLVDQQNIYLKVDFIPIDIQILTQTTLAHVYQVGLNYYQGLKQIHDWIETTFKGATVVGYNSDTFDLPMLFANLKTHGFLDQFASWKDYFSHLNATSLDLLPVCRKVFQGLPKHKLEIVAKHCQLDTSNHHRADGDVILTKAIYDKIYQSSQSMTKSISTHK